MFSSNITTTCLIGVVVRPGPEGQAARRTGGDGLRRCVRAGHRGADGEAGAHDGGGGDSRVTPGFPTSGMDRGWAFAHLALLSLLAECSGEPPSGSGAAAPVRVGAHPGAKAGITG